MFKHPSKKGVCIETESGGILKEYDIETGGNAVTYPKKPGTNGYPDVNILDDGEGGFILVGHYGNSPWCVFTSKHNEWRDIPHWTPAKNLTKQLCFVPEHRCFYYTVQGESMLHKVPFNLKSFTEQIKHFVLS